MFTSDTGLGHAASAVQVPTVTLYGRGNERKHFRWGVKDYKINKLPLDQYPGLSDDYFSGENGKRALENISVEEVIQLFEDALKLVKKDSPLV